MLQYLIILLDDTSIPFCHADNPLRERNLMSIDVLRKAIVWGMKNNLMIHYVYPDYEMPSNYESVIESIDNIKIGKDVCVFNYIPTSIVSKNIVLRLSISDFIESVSTIGKLLSTISRVSIFFNDIEKFDDSKIREYEESLSILSEYILFEYSSGHAVEANLLTDLIKRKQMCNCEAGIGNITIAPNGKFYICPAFYYDEKTGVYNQMNHCKRTSSRSVGDVHQGLHIPNRQLLELKYAPLCSICDCFHCNRCVWLNDKLTWEKNTPSHQQCVISHIERNATKVLIDKLISCGFNLDAIKSVPYLDPIELKLK